MTLWLAGFALLALTFYRIALAVLRPLPSDPPCKHSTDIEQQRREDMHSGLILGAIIALLVLFV